MNWKVERDGFYKELYEQYGNDFIVNAGFFEDTAIENYNIENSLDIMCTPLSFMKDALINAKRPCILLTTGSFSPIHTGHVEAMVKTKEKMETFGWDVIGGFFAPDHDEYISMKLKEEAIPFHYRMKLILEAVKNIEWLTVDPWAGIFQKNAVNFTDIYCRLEMYVKKHLGIQIPIVFVCGNDNARFANAFVNKGYCAIAERPGYDNKFEITAQMENRIFFVSKSDASSSTEVRKINKWKKEKKELIVRLSKEIEITHFEILKELENRFENRQMTIIEEQNESIKNVGNIVTLDPFTTECLAQLKISRNYDFFGIKKLGFINRPGSDNLDSQINHICSYLLSKRIILHDDDICSGDTIRFAKQLFKDINIDVIAQMSYTQTGLHEEIIDLRDLLYDEPEGGLVISQLDGSYVRVPYIYPFVCPFIRSSIEDPMQFSIRVWELNADRFVVKDHEKYKKCIGYAELLKSFI